MSLDPNKMLERCKKGQWSVEDFDWSETPKVVLDEEQETRICQLYMDMSYIERIAGALFLALSERMEDPVLKEIYHYCYLDEVRHSQAAYKLMDYFDVHHYKVYTPNAAMLKFIPYFTNAVKTLNPAIANTLILGGELILDIALLRGINEYVDDPMSQAVVEKINSDESRHLAMDFFMAEYCSENNMSIKHTKVKKGFMNPDIRGLMVYGPPFFNDVFFRPMAILDPTNKQMESVMRRLRRFNLKDEVQKNPTVKSFNEMADFFESALGGRVGWGLRKGIKLGTGINFDFVKAGAMDRIGINSGDYDPSKSATQLAKEIMNEVH